MADNSKEIISLSDFEHVLERPTMYVGSVKPSEEKVPVIKGGRIVLEPKTISVGFYKLFNEILDNAVDEAIRLKGKMKKITVSVTGKMISIQDTGEGVYKGTDINKKTGRTNIETAVSMLRAGSNFKNSASEETLIGTNGVGAAVVNMLSSYFSISTTNSSYYFCQTWENFTPSTKPVKQKISAADRKSNPTGTLVEFIPRADVFVGCEWDRDILMAIIVFKKFIIKNHPLLSKMELEFVWEGSPVDLNVDFLPKNCYIGKANIGTFVVYETYEGSTGLSFVNTAMCTGMHQRVFNELINEELDDALGHHFYETFIVLNLPPKLVIFDSQNKTKYSGTRDDIQGPLVNAFQGKLGAFFNTPLFKDIKAKVDARKESAEIKNLRNLKKKSNVKHSTKYTPPSVRTENLFIVEGESAAGGTLQRRNTKTDGVYALRGKIKNVRTVSDMSDNKVILELMQILDLDTDPTKRTHSYKRIVITVDGDPDGFHIFALLVNFFYRWFPYVIDEGRLYYMQIPLMSVADGKTREYFYDAKDYSSKMKSRVPKDLRYLKGLGSLDLDDWEFVMENKKMLQITKGKEADKYIEMAFSDDSELRKKWLARGYI